MADKNFKVKTGLDLPAPLPVSIGGTGQTTVENTRNAIMPAQVGHGGKFITTDGTSMTWAVAPQQTATDGAVGYKVFAGNTTPTGQNIGDIWIDGTTGNGIQLVRWRKTIASASSTLSGLDDNNLTLTYTAGNEQVYINGTLITRGQDYTATNGTSISLTQAVEVGDTVEIFGNPLFSVTDTYTQAQADSRYVNYSGLNAAGKNYIINGGMDIWQRGTSSGTVTGATKRFIVDRYWHSGGSSNISYSAFRQPSDLAGFQYFIRLQRTATTTGTEPIYFAQDLESINSIFLAGKTVTVSFYARKGADYSAGDIRLQLRSGTGTDESTYSGFTNSTNIINGVQFFPTASWVRYQASVTVPVNSTQLGVFLYFYPSGTAGTNDYIDITGIQLEVGSVATHFSRAGGTLQGELAACQRYFVRYIPNSTIGNTMYFASGNAISTTRAMLSIPLPTTLRSTPTFTKTSGVALFNQGSNFYLNSIAPFSSVYQMSQNIINFDAFVPSGLTNNTPVMMSLITSNDYIDFSAEI